MTISCDVNKIILRHPLNLDFCQPIHGQLPLRKSLVGMEIKNILKHDQNGNSLLATCAKF